MALWGWAVAALAQEPPPAPEDAAPVDPFFAPFEQVLDHAVSTYLNGDLPAALDLFQTLQRRLTFGEAPDPELAREALIYLGEVRYNLGEYDSANAVFRQILQADPEAPINPYNHPTEVVGAFELVRASVRAERATPPTDPPVIAPRRTPWWVVVPLGVPQLAQGQTGRGLAYGVAQGATGLISVATLVDLRSKNGTVADPHEWPADEYADYYRRVQIERFAVQWPATLGFYALWAASSLDARATWHRPSPVVGVAPAPGGAVFSVSSTF